MYGYDYNISKIAIFPSNIDVPVPMVLSCLELRNLLKTKVLTDLISIGWGPDGYIQTVDIRSYLYLKNTLDEKIAKMNRVIYATPPIKRYSSMENNDEFMSILNAPAALGAKLFKLDNYILTLFKGLLPNAKSDKIDLYIYPYTANSDLYRYIIYKKGNININVCCIALKLI